MAKKKYAWEYDIKPMTGGYDRNNAPSDTVFDTETYSKDYLQNYNPLKNAVDNYNGNSIFEDAPTQSNGFGSFQRDFNNNSFQGLKGFNSLNSNNNWLNNSNYNNQYAQNNNPYEVKSNNYLGKTKNFLSNWFKSNPLGKYNNDEEENELSGSGNLGNGLLKSVFNMDLNTPPPTYLNDESKLSELNKWSESTGNAMKSSFFNSLDGTVNMVRAGARAADQYLGDNKEGEFINSLNTAHNYLQDKTQSYEDKLKDIDPYSIQNFVNQGAKGLVQVGMAAIPGMGLGKVGQAIGLGGKALAATKMLPFGFQAGGNYASDAEKDGATKGQQLGYGLAGMVGETASEAMFGLSPLLKKFGKETASKLINEGATTLAGKYGKLGLSYLKNILGETAQEVIIDPVMGLAEKAIYNPNKSLTGEGGVLDGAQMKQDAFGGAAMAVMLSALGLGKNTLSHRKVSQMIENNIQPTPKIIDDIKNTMDIETKTFQAPEVNPGNAIPIMGQRQTQASLNSPLNIQNNSQNSNTYKINNIPTVRSANVGPVANNGLNNMLDAYSNKTVQPQVQNTTQATPQKAEVTQGNINTPIENKVPEITPKEEIKPIETKVNTNLKVANSIEPGQKFRVKNLGEVTVKTNDNNSLILEHKSGKEIPISKENFDKLNPQSLDTTIKQETPMQEQKQVIQADTPLKENTAQNTPTEATTHNVNDEVLLKHNNIEDAGTIKKVNSDGTYEIQRPEGDYVVAKKNGDTFESIKSSPTPKEQIPLDERSSINVGDRKIKAYQYLHPELKHHIQDDAKALKNDLNNTVAADAYMKPTYEGESGGYQEKYTKTKRLTSESIAYIKDTFKASYADIRTALDKIIEDNGKENNALSKKIELVINDRLSNGYRDMDGNDIEVNSDYVAKKNDIEGRNEKLNTEVEEEVVTSGNKKRSIEDNNKSKENAMLNNEDKKISEKFMDDINKGAEKAGVNVQVMLNTVKKIEDEITNTMIKEHNIKEGTEAYVAAKNVIKSDKDIIKSVITLATNEKEPITQEIIHEYAELWTTLWEKNSKGTFDHEVKKLMNKGNLSREEAREMVAEIFTDSFIENKISNKNDGFLKFMLKKFTNWAKNLMNRISYFRENVWGKLSPEVQKQANLFKEGKWEEAFSPYKQGDVNIENTRYAVKKKKDIVPERNSNSTEENLKEWFGDSKVADEGGKPLVVYHGSMYTGKGKKGINTFGGNRNNFWFAKDVEHANIFATGGRKQKKNVAGANITPVYLKLENPLNLKEIPLDKPITSADLLLNSGITREKASSIINEYYRSEVEQRKKLLESENLLDKYPDYQEQVKNKILNSKLDAYLFFDNNNFVEALKKNNIDGLIWRELNSETYAVFSPNQIKSAIGNIGNYDINNNDIRYSVKSIDKESDPILERYKKVFPKPGEKSNQQQDKEVTQSEEKPQEQPKEETKKDITTMTKVELFNAVDKMNPYNTYKPTERVEDWGTGKAKGQGKRVGKMVMGGMGDAPQGKKTYVNLVGEVPEFKTRPEDFTGMENIDKINYLKAREYGLNHSQAMVYQIVKRDSKGLTDKKIMDRINHYENHDIYEDMTQDMKDRVKSYEEVDKLKENKATKESSSVNVDIQTHSKKIDFAGMDITALSRRKQEDEEAFFERVRGRKPTEADMKKRQLIENSFMNSEAIPEELKNMLKEHPEYWVYIEHHNKDAKEEAERLVNNDLKGMIARIKNKGISSDLDSAIALEIERKFIEDGDFESANEWSLRTAKLATGLGQAIQYFSILKRMTPQWSLNHVQKKINEATTDAQTNKLEEKSNEVADKLNEVNKEVVEKVINKVSKEIDKSNTNGFPEEMLADKIASHMKQPERKDDPIRDMVNTLYKVAQQTIGRKEIKARTPLEFIKDAMNNQIRYEDVWQQARNIVATRYEDDINARIALDDYFNQFLDKPFADKQLSAAVKQAIKENKIDLDKIVRQHYTVVNDTSKTLSKVLTENGLKEDAAKELAKFVENEFKAQATAKKEMILGTIFKENPNKGKERKEFYKKIIELSNLGAFSNEKYKVAVAKKYDLPYLSNKAAKKIVELSNKVQETKTGTYENKKARAELLDYMDTQMSYSTLDKILKRTNAIQVMFMLTNTKTATRNIVSNLMFGGVNHLKDYLRTGIDIGISKLTKERTSVIPDLKTKRQGYKEGAKERNLDWKYGINTKDIDDKTELGRRKTFGRSTSKNVIVKSADKFFGKWEDTTSWLMDDRPFMSAAIKDSIRKQMKLAKINGKDFNMDEAIKKANEEGLYATFNDKNRLSTGLTKFQRWLNFDKDWGLGSVLLRFAKTPANIFVRAVDYSPANLFKTLYHAGKLASTKDTFYQEKFVDELAKTITGSGLVYLGVLLARMGALVLDPDKDKDKNALDKQTGIGTFKVNVSAIGRVFDNNFNKQAGGLQKGDLLVSFDWAVPMATALIFGGQMESAKTPGQAQTIGQNVSDYFSAIGEATNGLLNQPMLQNLSKFFSPYSTKTEALKDMLLSVPQSFVPSTLNQIRQLIDNQTRETYSLDPNEEVVNKVKSRTPGLSETLPNKMGTTGENLTNYQSDSPFRTNHILNVMLNPALVTRYKPTPQEEVVKKIYDETGNKIQYPKLVDKKMPLGAGETLPLTTKEYIEYQTLMGKGTIEILKGYTDDVLNSQHDKGYYDDVAKEVQNKVTDLHKDVKDKILGGRMTEGTIEGDAINGVPSMLKTTIEENMKYNTSTTSKTIRKDAENIYSSSKLTPEEKVQKLQNLVNRSQSVGKGKEPKKKPEKANPYDK